MSNKTPEEVIELMAPTEEDPPEEGAPLWAMTFGDIMSLLLCFFVLMFSMSEIKVEKILIAADSLRSGLGNGSTRMLEDAGMGGSSAVDSDVLMSDPAPYDITIAMDDVDDFMEFIGTTLESFVARRGVESYVDVKQDPESVSLNIQDVVLFDTGSAELRAQSRDLIEELGRIVTDFDMPVVVAGHTDDRPIRTRVFPSNWELSSARASTVARIVVQQGLAPSQIHVEGYAEHRPTATNETAEGRSKNRRVAVLYTRDNVISQLIEQKQKEKDALASSELALDDISPAEVERHAEPR